MRAVTQAEVFARFADIVEAERERDPLWEIYVEEDNIVQGWRLA